MLLREDEWKNNLVRSVRLKRKKRPLFFLQLAQAQHEQLLLIWCQSGKHTVNIKHDKKQSLYSVDKDLVNYSFRREHALHFDGRKVSNSG